MKPEIKTKWLEALRSGNYAQGSCALKEKLWDNPQKAQFCCLGVLADVMGCEWDNDETHHRMYPMRDGIHLNQTNYLSYDFLKEIGLENADQHTLANMNDDGFDFEYIADYIEKNL